ncbi:MAG: hypothetical protein IE933_08910 [Sphingomonadales bacterium]|nr:hypothetical protein [Sphingomonadales bacterium]MBD3774316.1 hypothetical protein [Paracoccaceae bacterium]
MLAPALLAATTAPLAAQDDFDDKLAESRLRGCLLAGAGSAPEGGLHEAIISIRAFCGAQIRRVQDIRVAAATAGLTGEAAEQAEKQAILHLNDEIAQAIANFTGRTN